LKSTLDGKATESGRGGPGTTGKGRGKGKRRKKKIGMLYLVIPITGGDVPGFAKFGFCMVPVDCTDFLEAVKKHAERYGTSYKDEEIS